MPSCWCVIGNRTYRQTSTSCSSCSPLRASSRDRHVIRRPWTRAAVAISLVPQPAALRPLHSQVIPVWWRYAAVAAPSSRAIASLLTANACRRAASWLNWPRPLGSHPIRVSNSIAGRRRRIRVLNEINLAGRVLCCRRINVRNRQQQLQWQRQLVQLLPHLRHLLAWGPAMLTTCRRPAQPARPHRPRPLQRLFRW